MAAKSSAKSSAKSQRAGFATSQASKLATYRASRKAPAPPSRTPIKTTATSTSTPGKVITPKQAYSNAIAAGKTEAQALAAHKAALPAYQAWDAAQKATTVPKTPAPVMAPEQADMITGDARIPDDLKPLFQQVVKNWDPNQELNLKNVVGAFDKIKSSTIDPYFKEQIQQFTNDVKQATGYQTQADIIENEQMRTAQGENIRQTRQGLEASGLTFTGEGVRHLGAESAYAQRGQGPMPSQIPFGGQFEEGSTIQANRLMASSTGLRQRKAAEDLARQAERTLGSKGAQGLVPGGKMLGDVTQGTIEQEKQRAYSGALGSLYGQQQQLGSYSEPVKLFN